MECKASTESVELCRGFPAQFEQYITYARGLKFEDRPDYTWLRRMLKELFVRELHDFDYIYDWTLLNF